MKCANCHDTHTTRCVDSSKIRVGEHFVVDAFKCLNCGHVTPRDSFEIVGGVL